MLKYVWEWIMSNEEILLKMLIHKKLAEYLKCNPERFTKAEKEDLEKKVYAWIEVDEKWILDEVEDFLVWAGIYKHKKREKPMASLFFNCQEITLPCPCLPAHW